MSTTREDLLYAIRTALAAHKDSHRAMLETLHAELERIALFDCDRDVAEITRQLETILFDLK